MKFFINHNQFIRYLDNIPKSGVLCPFRNCDFVYNTGITLRNHLFYEHCVATGVPHTPRVTLQAAHHYYLHVNLIISHKNLFFQAARAIDKIALKSNRHSTLTAPKQDSVETGKTPVNFISLTLLLLTVRHKTSITH